MASKTIELLRVVQFKSFIRNGIRGLKATQAQLSLRGGLYLNMLRYNTATVPVYRLLAVYTPSRLL